MLNLSDGEIAVRFSREIVETKIKNRELSYKELPDRFNKKLGAFVTILTFPERDLRGCIGIPEPIMPLKDAIKEAASSAIRDPRFPPLREEELQHVVIEVTVLTKPELINVGKPREYLDEIKIGRDGLIAEQGFYRGLLLPQVPVEQRWNVEEFLSQTCMKAGLPLDCWFDRSTKIYRFSGQIFSEKTPYGDVEERKID